MKAYEDVSIYLFIYFLWPYWFESAQKSWAHSLVWEHPLVYFVERKDKEEMVDRIDGVTRYAVWYKIFLAPGLASLHHQGYHGKRMCIARNDPTSSQSAGLFCFKCINPGQNYDFGRLMQPAHLLVYQTWINSTSGRKSKDVWNLYFIMFIIYDYNQKLKIMELLSYFLAILCL